MGCSIFKYKTNYIDILIYDYNNDTIDLCNSLKEVDILTYEYNNDTINLCNSLKDKSYRSCYY
jgi:hypothetical protein